MAKFVATEHQTINIYFTLAYECDSFDLDTRIAEAVLDAADESVESWDIISSDFASDKHESLDANEEYYIKLKVQVRVEGTCDYDPGRNYGPMEDCYPAEVSDVDYDSGMITDVDESEVMDNIPEISGITVVIDDVDGDGELEIEDY